MGKKLLGFLLHVENFWWFYLEGYSYHNLWKGTFPRNCDINWSTPGSAMQRNRSAYLQFTKRIQLTDVWANRLHWPCWLILFILKVPKSYKIQLIFWKLCPEKRISVGWYIFQPQPALEWTLSLINGSYPKFWLQMFNISKVVQEFNLQGVPKKGGLRISALYVFYCAMWAFKGLLNTVGAD